MSANPFTQLAKLPSGRLPNSPSHTCGESVARGAKLAGGEGKPFANQQNRPLPSPLPQAGEGICALGYKRVYANQACQYGGYA